MKALVFLMVYGFCGFVAAVIVRVVVDRDTETFMDGDNVALPLLAFVFWPLVLVALIVLGAVKLALMAIAATATLLVGKPRR